MPTASILGFWFDGWGPPNSLVIEDIDLIALPEAAYAFLARPHENADDGYLALVGEEVQV